MKLRLNNIDILGSKNELRMLNEGKLLIKTINAHSYNTVLKDSHFYKKSIFNNHMFIIVLIESV